MSAFAQSYGSAAGKGIATVPDRTTPRRRAKKGTPDKPRAPFIKRALGTFNVLGDAIA